MIDARELRIGNWLNADLSEGITEAIPIQIKSSDIVEMELHPDDYFAPIPLTAEWLERFGFKLIHDGELWMKSENNEAFFYVEVADMSMSIYCRPLEDDPNGCDYLTPDKELTLHVHQLQNLYFALTGEELILQP